MPYRAEITVAGGRIIEVVAPAGVLTAREHRCLRTAVAGLHMEGIGMVEPVTLLIDIEVGSAPAAPPASGE